MLDIFFFFLSYLRKMAFSNNLVFLIQKCKHKRLKKIKTEHKNAIEKYKILATKLKFFKKLFKMLFTKNQV